VAETVHSEEFAKRLKALCLSTGGSGLPARQRDREIFLRAAAQHLDAARDYDERALNEVLEDWIERLARWMGVDHVSLRREMVDAGYLSRDAAGRSYRVNLEGFGRVEFDPSVAEIDGPALIAAEREVLERRRREWADR
jgi:hypothetical protein